MDIEPEEDDPPRPPSVGDEVEYVGHSFAAFTGLRGKVVARTEVGFYVVDFNEDSRVKWLNERGRRLRLNPRSVRVVRRVGAP